MRTTGWLLGCWMAACTGDGAGRFVVDAESGRDSAVATDAAPATELPDDATSERDTSSADDTVHDTLVESDTTAESDTLAESDTTAESDTLAESDTAPAATTPDAASETEAATHTGWPYPLAFFYQTVTPSQNQVRVGWTYDGQSIEGEGADAPDVALTWTVVGATYVWGDPVMSRLGDDAWAVTGWTGHDSLHSGGDLLYVEAACPKDLPPVGDPRVKAIAPKSHASDPLCRDVEQAVGGKTSQVFAVAGSNFLFLNLHGAIQLVKLTDGARSGSPNALCFLQTPADSLNEMRVGDATEVLSPGLVGAVASGNAILALSDTAIAMRPDGTWVLFVKGIAQDLVQPGNCHQLCELCNRGIYRTTSADLLHWAPLERVAWRASVPEATVDPEGHPWLYYQDFAQACDANDPILAQRAAISGIHEDASGAMSDPIHIHVAGASFETDAHEHYPTNGNPVALPDLEALSALQACTP